MLGNLFVQSTSFEEKNKEDDNQAVSDEVTKDVFSQSKDIVRKNSPI